MKKTSEIFVEMDKGIFKCNILNVPYTYNSILRKLYTTQFNIALLRDNDINYEIANNYASFLNRSSYVRNTYITLSEAIEITQNIQKLVEVDRINMFKFGIPEYPQICVQLDAATKKIHGGNISQIWAIDLKTLKLVENEEQRKDVINSVFDTINKNSLEPYEYSLSEMVMRPNKKCKIWN